LVWLIWLATGQIARPDAYFFVPQLCVINSREKQQEVQVFCIGTPPHFRYHFPMLIYKDSGPNDNDSCPGDWFDTNLATGLRGFGCQFGFFRFGVLAKYAEVLSNAAKAGAPIKFVLGSNATDPLTVEDLSSLLKITSLGESCSLTVVAFRNALFHPKVAYVLDARGAIHGFVGSANFTRHAFGANVESWIEIGPSEVTRSVLAGLRQSTDSWRYAGVDVGAYQVVDSESIERLLAAKIVTTNRARSKAVAKSRAGTWGRTSSLISRGIRWTAPKYYEEAEDDLLPGSIAEEPDDVEEADDSTEDPGDETTAVDEGNPFVVNRWWKRLTRSDVMRKPETSHQRNYLILGQAGHGIDQTTWFRDTFFGPVTGWRQVTMRTGNIKEVVDLRFEVFVELENRGHHIARIEHAPNRIANQGNSPTWLNWSGLTQIILESDFTGWYVVIERLNPLGYRLRLTRTEPT
jgi:hypothetical protein